MKKFKLYTHFAVHIIMAIIGVFAASSNDMNSTLGGIDILILYLTIALLSIFGSIIVLTHVQKVPSAVKWKFLVIVIPFWIFSPYIISRVSELIPDHSNSESIRKALKKSTLKAIHNLGIKQYQWDSILQRYRITSRSGKAHYLVADKRTLIIYAQIYTPVVTDTVQWIKTTFANSIDYIPLKTVLVLNDCLKNGNYEYKFIPTIGCVSLTLGPPTPYEEIEIAITGECNIPVQASLRSAEICIRINQNIVKGN